MAAKECKASVTEEDISNGNTPSASALKQDIAGEERWNDADTVCKEFAEGDGEELFKNIPELRDIFHIKSKIGEGTFSNVFLAHLIEDPEELFALKYIIPTSSPERVEREVRCLQQMGGSHNVVGYKGTLRNRDHSVIVLPYFSHDKFQEYLGEMTMPDICNYMRNLFEALSHIHSFAIIHRDIKPGNFLYSRATKRYNLVDFGLAMHEPGSDKAWDIEKKKEDKTVSKKNTRALSPESSKTSQVTKRQRTSPRFALPSHKLTKSTGTKLGFRSTLTTAGKGQKQGTKAHKDGQSRVTSGLCATNHKRTDVCSLCMNRSSQNTPRAGTSGFRAPEVLMKYPQQTTAVDIWSAGVIMLCLLSGRYPFFRCFDDMTALAQIISLFGKQRVMENSKHIGKYVVCNSPSPGFNLKNVCQKLRSVSKKESKKTKCCAKCATKSRTRKTEKPQPDSNSDLNLKSTRLSVSEVGVPKTKVRFLSTGHDSEQEEKTMTGKSEQHLDGSICLCICGTCLLWVPDSAYELLERCLDLNPATRITANEALKHSFFALTKLSNATER